MKLLVKSSVAMPLVSWSLIFWRMARTDVRSAAAAAVSLTVMTSRATIAPLAVVEGVGSTAAHALFGEQNTSCPLAFAACTVASVGQLGRSSRIRAR